MAVSTTLVIASERSERGNLTNVPTWYADGLAIRLPRFLRSLAPEPLKAATKCPWGAMTVEVRNCLSLRSRPQAHASERPRQSASFGRILSSAPAMRHRTTLLPSPTPGQIITDLSRFSLLFTHLYSLTETYGAFCERCEVATAKTIYYNDYEEVYPF